MPSPEKNLYHLIFIFNFLGKAEMPGTHHELLYHLVFSTKCRKPYLQANTRVEMFSYLGGVIRGLEGVPIIVGGWVDHVHILAKLKTTHQLSEFMREVKSRSSKHINETSGILQKFGWQDGYGAFTVSPSQKESVIRYINRQESHHRTVSFESEYIRMLQLAEIKYDEKYLWD
jgi:putative transposase